MRIRKITRDWKGTYTSHDVAWVKGMFLHGSEECMDDGNGYNMLFVSEQTDIPPAELNRVWIEICINERKIEGYRQIDHDTIEKVK